MWFTSDNLHLVPNKDDEYICSPFTTATNFTHLMKLVLLTGESLEAFDMLKQMLVTIDSKILNAQNSKGWTALMLAVQNFNTQSTLETVKLVVKAGANLDITNEYGQTALMFACETLIDENNIEIVELLINAGANLNVRSNIGRTALMYAIKHYHIYDIETVRLLVLEDADVNIQCNNGWTALMYAVMNSNTGTIKLLIDYGANPMLKTKDNKTICEIIAKKDTEYLQILKLLSDAELHYILTF